MNTSNKTTSQAMLDSDNTAILCLYLVFIEYVCSVSVSDFSWCMMFLVREARMLPTNNVYEVNNSTVLLVIHFFLNYIKANSSDKRK